MGLAEQSDTFCNSVSFSLNAPAFCARFYAVYDSPYGRSELPYGRTRADGIVDFLAQRPTRADLLIDHLSATLLPQQGRGGGSSFVNDAAVRSPAESRVAPFTPSHLRPISLAVGGASDSIFSPLSVSTQSVSTKPAQRVR